MKSITASSANKLMTMPISRFRMPTLGTTFRRVLGVNLDDGKAEVSRFVLQALFQLVKRPRIHVPALCFAQAVLGVCADPIQMFKCYRWGAGLFGEVNDAAANRVVDSSHKTRFFPAQPLQRTPNRPRVLRCLLPLERCPSVQIAAADMLDPLTAKELRVLAVRGNGQIVNPTIDADHGIVGLGAWFDCLAKGNREEDGAFADKQSGVTELPVRQIVIQFGRTVKAYLFNPSGQCPNTQTITPKAKVAPAFTALQSNCVAGLEVDCFFQFDFGGFGRLIFGRNLANSILSYLSRQVKLATNLIIGQVIELDRIVRNGQISKSKLANEVASCIPARDSLLCAHKV